LRKSRVKYVCAGQRVLTSTQLEGGVRITAIQIGETQEASPEVFNTDQGARFTGSAFTGVLANNDIAIRMDGKEAWRDNVFVERLAACCFGRTESNPVRAVRVGPSWCFGRTNPNPREGGPHAANGPSQA
jgi:hypothetical protein